MEQFEPLQQIADRVRAMEACFDCVTQAWNTAPEQIYKPGRVRAALQRLRRYYDGGQWLADYAADEAGLLPPGLKRGVLSQDGLDDLLCEIGWDDINREGTEMRFEEMLLKRESCRAYRDTPVAREDLEKICRAGILSPSACNSQPWKFLVVDETESREKLCDALLLPNGKTGAPWREQCPAFIVLVEQKANVMPIVLNYYHDSQYFARGDLEMAALNMCYQAMDLGLSTCMLGMIDQQKMEQNFGLTGEDVVRLVIAVGYAAQEQPPRTKMRKNFDEVVCFNAWKTRLE